MTKIDEARFRKAKVLPVIEIDDAGVAEDLAAALLAGGVDVIELTLRTEAALPALSRIKLRHSAMFVGMGTVLSRENAKASVDAGADFIVTPGATDALLEGLSSIDVFALPGVATISEAMRALERGFDFCKFFPAEASGGAAALKSFAGPLPAVRFCPTGGVNYEKIAEYLKLVNVVCVGGSWVAPKSEIARCAWDEITRNAERISAL